MRDAVGAETAYRVGPSVELRPTMIRLVEEIADPERERIDRFLRHVLACPQGCGDRG